MLKQAVILSAGLGTRLRPVTAEIPKVMLPIVGKPRSRNSARRLATRGALLAPKRSRGLAEFSLRGKPLLERNIEQFKKYGVKEFFLNLHYLPDVIKNYFGDGSKWGVKINYHFESEILGTAGGIKNFEPYLDDEFFAMYGDIFSLMDYSKYYEYWKTKPDAIGMQRVGDTDNSWDKDLVEVDDDLRFIKIYPKPRSRNSAGRVSNAPERAPEHSRELAEFSLRGKPHKELPKDYRGMRGIFILKKRILDYIPANTYYEIGSQLLPDILERGEKFYGYECGDYSKGIDTLEAYEKVQEKHAKTD